MSKNIESSVFFEDDSYCLSKLKSCAFFWGQICVYPMFLDRLQDVPTESQEYRDLETLINTKVIKFAVEDETEFKSYLMDKTLCRMDENLRENLYKNSNDFIVETNIPQNSLDIIKAASFNEYNNDVLKKSLDDALYHSIKNNIIDDMSPELKSIYYSPREDIQKVAAETVDDLTSFQYSQYQEIDEYIRYNFEWKNESLILKNSVSSSILTNEYLYTYYNYKLNNFKISDANLYLEGLDAAIPLVNKKYIDDFSLEDILEIRKMKVWKKAMGRLGEICSTSKYHYNTEEFKEEISQEVMDEVLDAFDSTRQSKKDLGTGVTKNAFWTAISFIPVFGPAISAIGSTGDAVLSYFINERKQNALPVFMNNIRKMK